MSSLKFNVKLGDTYVCVLPSAGMVSLTIVGGTTSVSRKSMKYSAINPRPELAKTRA